MPYGSSHNSMTTRTNPRSRLQLPIAMGCVIREGAVLLARRNEPDLPELHDKWEFPGGRIEFGEQPDAACVREIFEETGVRARPSKMLLLPYARVRRYKDHNIHAIVVCFECDYLGATTLPQLPRKITDVRWFPIPTIDPIAIQPGTLFFLSLILQQSPYSLQLKSFRPTSSFLFLTSVNPRDNRFRRYNFSITSQLSSRPTFVLQRSWGRLDALHMTSQTHEFTSADDLHTYLCSVLRTRLAHNYQIVYRSPNFPTLEPLVHFRVLSDHPHQLSLDLDQ